MDLPITSKLPGLILAYNEVYLIQPYVIKFVIFEQVYSFLQ